MSFLQPLDNKTFSANVQHNVCLEDDTVSELPSMERLAYFPQEHEPRLAAIAKVTSEPLYNHN